MPAGPPPSRYRVVERGRRLEVIDTRTGTLASGAPQAAPPAAPPTAGSSVPGRWPTLPEQGGFDGRSALLTHRWYDAKAPRRLLLDPGTSGWIGIAKGAAIVAAMALVIVAIAAPIVLAVLLLPLALLRRPVRDALRTAATGWLDRFDPA